MSQHTNYQPAKRGLLDKQIEDAKVLRAVRNHFKKEEFGGMHSLIAKMQHQRLRYSDQGDFTRCYRGGF
jgi:hypothetical protein